MPNLIPPARADGAYRKATTGLVSSMLSFWEEEEEDLTWAKELLSTSTLEGQAYSDPALEPPLAPHSLHR